MQIAKSKSILDSVLSVLLVGSSAFEVLNWKTVTLASVVWSTGWVTYYVVLLCARALTGTVGVQGGAFKDAIKGENFESHIIAVLTSDNI